jgi:hypothetical protein
MTTVEVLDRAAQHVREGMVDPHDTTLVAALWRAAGLPERIPAGATPDPEAEARYDAAVAVVLRALGFRPTPGGHEVLHRWDFCRGRGARLAALAQARRLAAAE